MDKPYYRELEERIDHLLTLAKHSEEKDRARIMLRVRIHSEEYYRIFGRRYRCNEERR